MWRTLVMVVVLVGCVDPNKSSRWPGHRKDHDARLDKLATELEAENQQITNLSKRIAQLEAQLVHVVPPPGVPVPSPAPVPPAATAPDTAK